MKFFRSWALYFAWVIALIATLSSIYSSEMLNYQPCIFCWYQRIFMFPLVIILGIGVYTRDPKVVTYAIAFPVLGALVALYQTLVIYLNVPSFICGIKCTQENVKIFNFVDMSIASFLAFAAIFFLLLVSRAKHKS